MSGPNCHNCIYSVCDAELWLRLVWMGKPLVPRCANHPQWPGQLHEVTGIPCRNYRRKPATPGGEVRLIPLAEGHYAYVDAADYEWLSRWKWGTASGGYAGRSENSRTILMHREIMQPPKGMVVDHADGNRANNCRFNLRVCTRQENQRNARKQRGTRFRFKGVCYSKRRNRYFAQCRFAGKDRWFGYFDDEVEAARAYDRAAVEECGEFARVNFPREWPPERRKEVHTQWLARTKAQQKKAARKGGKRNTPAGKKKDTTKESAKLKRMEDHKVTGRKAGPDRRTGRCVASGHTIPTRNRKKA
ncbi:MAG TPA: HNH endonuclease [Sedimentisphaerales bacterium]|nr:HNH endonuclease [Sedimentisphaerales bacterium]HNU28402.1 HNH endonuclease [Sedimentisphaerales bacterium]